MVEQKRSILIVDDDRSILRVFTRVLERKGYKVTAAENGKDGLSHIKRARFDAALIDVRLPDMEGTNLLPVIQETSPRTVKIVFTGSPDLESLNNGCRKNMDAFLLKPVSPDVILDILNQKIKQRLD
jgi:two-component system, NtrC family, response regulator GlrR